jgi:crossover junction endodeoxyribonuclease RuvC
MKIIGIDPGYAITGWGVIESKPSLKAVEYGAIYSDAGLSSGERLSIMYRNIVDVLKKHKPEAAVLENLFFSTNKKTAAEVYQARGVLLLALTDHVSRILEISPVTIKQTVTGSGRAKKNDVLRMVRRLLNIEEKISPDDISDALAGAIAGAFHMSSESYYRAIKEAK